MKNEMDSIIVPIYNGEAFLEDCIKSIINQTYKNIEIILINDGSTDKTARICENYKKKDSRIVIVNKENTGVSDSRNLGIKIAKGKYIMFADCDDRMDCCMIEKMYNILINNKVDCVRCNYFGGEKFKEKIYNNKEIKDSLIFNILSGKLKCYVWLLLIDINKLSDITFDDELYLMEDTKFYIELLSIIKSIYICNDELYFYNTNNPNSVTKSSKYYISNMRHYLTINKKIRKILQNNNLENKKNIKELNGHTVFNIINQTYLTYKNNPKDFNQSLKKFRELLNDKRFLEIARDIDFKNVNIIKRKQIKYMMNEKYYKIYFVYFFRKNIYKIKRLLKI